MTMHTSSFDFGETGSEQLIARRPDSEPPEFDITAMVDVVVMMSIYLPVTFVTVALGEMKLPAAKHVLALNADSAVVLTVARSLDGKSVTVFLGDGDKAEAIHDVALQEKRVQEAVEQGKVAGKTEVLLKAEKKVRLVDLFRVATAAAADGMKLHVAVLEKEK